MYMPTTCQLLFKSLSGITYANLCKPMCEVRLSSLCRKDTERLTPCPVPHSQPATDRIQGSTRTI